MFGKQVVWINAVTVINSTDALRTSFIQHIQYQFHDAGQVKDGAGAYPAFLHQYNGRGKGMISARLSRT